MANPESDGQTTLNWTPSGSSAQLANQRRGVTLTVLAHADASRIGETYSAALDGSQAIRISRLEPEFGRAGGASRPLLDRFVSRSPVEITPTRGGSVQIWPGRKGLVYSLDGVPGVGGESLGPNQLSEGVVLDLAGRVLLLVEAGIRPRIQQDRHGLVGVSAALEEVRNTIDAVAPLAVPVLLRAATGSGKELVAAAIHHASQRASFPFVAVNAAALIPSTAVGQLFGHRKGAFTGATEDRRGYFGDAHRGTLFLDEVGEIPIEIQVALLRALDSGEVQPVGGAARKVSVRLITATDANLEQMVEDGVFRPALLYRLAGWTVEIPPLRDRPADIATQLVHFLRAELANRGLEELLTDRGSDAPPWLGIDTMRSLLGHSWPGNTRELRAMASQMAARYANKPCAMTPPGIDTTKVVEPEREAPAALSEVAVREALSNAGYAVRSAARQLSISPTSLYALMKEYQIPSAGEVTAEAIQAARAEVGDDARALAKHLQVSLHGLRCRVRELEA
jgi:two-component system, NtrC family, nitrogen regulation response regulator GlnG